MAEPLSTTSSAEDPLDAPVDRLRAAQQSSPETFEDVNHAVGLYLKRQPAGQHSVDHQAELEELLGSQWGNEIQAAQANYFAGKAQMCREGPERCKNSEADPVMMFNGQFVYTAADIRINGAGIHFAFARIYKNQAFVRGVLGYNWGHNYDLWLREEGNTLVRSSGELREDRYVRHESHPYFVPPDGFHDTIEPDGDSYTLRTPSGARFIYEREGQTQRHRVARVEDRNGNYLSFDYDGDSRLERVEINTPDRWVAFAYDLEGRLATIAAYPVTYAKQGGIQGVSRVWRYAYDDFGDLVAVTAPATSDHPAGLTTRYEYSSEAYSGELAHNLVRVYDPAGQLFLENGYGTQRGVLDYNRVVRQRQGRGEYLFEYEDVLPEASWDYAPEEIPAHRTLFYQRNGHVIEYVYNSLGNLLVKHENARGECSLRPLVRRYRYNRDGALVGSLSAEGSLVQFLFGREDFYTRAANPGDPTVKPWQDQRLTATERRRFGNQLAIVKRGRPYTQAMLSLARGLYGDIFPSVLASDPDDVILKFTYEPVTQQLLTVSDPRFTRSADPRDAETAAYRRHLTVHEYSAAPRANLKRITYPDTSFPAALPDGTTQLTATTFDYLAYDSRGRLLRSRDPDGVVTEFEFFIGGRRDGYLRREVRDATGLTLAITYEVNEAGGVVARTNPRGIRSENLVNELGQVVEEVSGGPRFHLHRFYDRNGLPSREERENLDEAGIAAPEGVEVRTFRYDAQNNLVRETLGGADLAGHQVTTHSYDASDLRVETTLPRGNRLRFTYDERLLPRSTTRGAGSPAASITRVFHDGDGRKVLAVDGRGYETRFQYDALGRLTATTDALGSIHLTEYDKLSQPTLERFFQLRADGAYDLLSRRAYEYDERGNCVREIAYLFEAPIRTVDVDAAPDGGFDAAVAAGDVSVITTISFYDRSRRLFRLIDALGRETVYEYDALGRRILERDALGSYVRTTLNENGNPVRVDRHEVVRHPQTAVVLREDVFSGVTEYDDLDRRTALVDALGNRTTFSYDSRGNVTSTVDPLGNVKRSAYDVFGRKSREVAQMTDSGLGGGARAADIVVQYDYDENGNLTAVVDGAGARTGFEYDNLDRRVRTTFGDGTDMRVEYGPDDDVITQVDNNGLKVLYDVDALMRLARLQLDKSGLPPGSPYPTGAEEFEEYEYDGLGRPGLERNDFAEVRTRYDSLGRPFEEQVRLTTGLGPPATPLVLHRRFDSVSNRTSLVYPSGRELWFFYDAVNRVTRTEHRSDGAAYPGSSTLAAPYDVARYEYRGLRLARSLFASGAGYEVEYDAGARGISVRHFSPAGMLLQTQQLFDGAGNRRYQRDDPAPAGRPSGEAYSYDSLYRLTRFDRRAIPPVNAGLFAPPANPLPWNALQGQQAIDQAIGSLAQDPVNYTYRYDAAGNREEERLPARAPTAYTVNRLNQYLSVGAAALRYDANGNLTDDGVRSYRYNYRNQLSEVVDQTGATELRLLYDADGRLILFLEAGAAVHLVYDGRSVVEEYSGGNLVTQYVNENGIDRCCQAAAGGEEWWYHQDLLRSTRLLTGATGQQVARYDYDPFGDGAASVVHANAYCFAGKRLHRGVDLYDSRARQYSPSLGRFLQRDPTGMADGPNLYAYAHSNPASYVDPLGTSKSGVVEFSPAEAAETPISAGERLTLDERFPLAAQQYDEALAGTSGEARKKVHDYYQAKLLELRREAYREGHIGTMKFAAVTYTAGIAGALGGMAGGAVGLGVASELGAMGVGLGTVETAVLAGGLGGVTGAAASELVQLPFGKPDVSGTSLLLGAGLGMASGLLGSAYHYHEYPVNSSFYRGQPGVIAPGKYGWQFVQNEAGGMIRPPIGAKTEPDLPPLPGLHRAHYQGYFIGGGNKTFYSAPRVNTSPMKIFENTASRSAQGGYMQVTTMRGGGVTSLEWSAYTPRGQSMHLGVHNVLDPNIPKLGPVLRANEISVAPGTTIWLTK